jgi:pilus assembly protein CpaB
VSPRRILIALVLALFASGLCTWIVSRKLTAPPPAPPVNRYVVPSRAIQAGEVLNPTNSELAAWPAAVPIDGAFSRLTDVNGRAVLYPLAKGQPILDRNLSAAGSGIGLATRIPDGMRAVALRSDEVVGVAGFLLPGSRVDVLVTYRCDQSSETLTATVIEDALVLATGHQIEPSPEGKTSDVTIVTLLLTPEESQRAVLAGTQGSIHFALRNGGDTGRSVDTATLLSELSGRSQPAPHTAAIRAATPQPQPAPKRHEIETILASDSGGSGDLHPPDRGPGQ